MAPVRASNRGHRAAQQARKANHNRRKFRLAQSHVQMFSRCPPSDSLKINMPSRQNIPAGTEWSKSICYSRAVRSGTFIAVSQTSAVDENGDIKGGSDAYQQAVNALRNLEKALMSVGASLKDVIRTRIYLARFEDWEHAARAHAELFEQVRPAVSLLTCQMIDPRILVEFEADAVLDSAE